MGAKACIGLAVATSALFITITLFFIASLFNDINGFYTDMMDDINQFKVRVNFMKFSFPYKIFYFKILAQDFGTKSNGTDRKKWFLMAYLLLYLSKKEELVIFKSTKSKYCVKNKNL